jgi:hypothetical protein
MNNELRLDRTAFAALSFEDADKSISQFHEHTWKERLLIANRLTAIAYNFPLNDPPRMDKTHFEIHQHNG